LIAALVATSSLPSIDGFPSKVDSGHSCLGDQLAWAKCGLLSHDTSKGMEAIVHDEGEAEDDVANLHKIVYSIVGGELYLEDSFEIRLDFEVDLLPLGATFELAVGKWSE